MTPADGSDFHHDAPEGRLLPASQAILLHGGRALLLVEDAETPFPLTGHLLQHGRRSLWTAEMLARRRRERRALAWRRRARGRAGFGSGTCRRGRGRPVAARRRAADRHRRRTAGRARAPGGRRRPERLCLPDEALAGRAAGDSAEARAYRSFARAFIDAAAERDGFVELVASPETGGFFAQGWSRSLPSGSALVADAAEDLSLREVEVAHFARDDILPPGNGFCFFGKGWREESLAAVDAVFFESGGRLLRLDVVGETPQLAGEAATAHVVQMLPRLSADARTLDGFKRICRPRFAGVDTLTGTQVPVAAALDMLLQAPDGGLLAIGWLLDPLHRVERALIKSTANLYGQLDADWCLLPRPDLVRGFGQDPRFANLLDETDVMHGFVVHVPASREQVAGAEVYLEIVLEEGGCLFRPLAVTPFENAVAAAATSCSPSHRTSRSSPRSCATILRRSCAASGRPGAPSHGRRVARSPSAAAAASGRPRR